MFREKEQEHYCDHCVKKSSCSRCDEGIYYCEAYEAERIWKHRIVHEDGTIEEVITKNER